MESLEGEESLPLYVGTLFGVCMFLPQHYVSRPCPSYLQFQCFELQVGFSSLRAVV